MTTTSRDSRAIIHILAPSCHEAGGMSLAGTAYDEYYFHKVIAHELGTLFLIGVNESKAGGWSLADAPSWFSEGYQEYLGLNFSSEYSKTISQAYYLAQSRNNSERIRFGIVVENPYLDGANIVRFLHENYGYAKVHSIVSSEQQDFWDAMREVTGLGPVGLVDEYKAWLMDSRR